MKLKFCLLYFYFCYIYDIVGAQNKLFAQLVIFFDSHKIHFDWRQRSLLQIKNGDLKEICAFGDVSISSYFFDTFSRISVYHVYAWRCSQASRFPQTRALCYLNVLCSSFFSRKR